MYMIALGVGVGFILLSLLVGELDFEFDGFSFLKPTLISIMLVAFGMSGLIITPRLPNWAAWTFIADFIGIIVLVLSLFIAFFVGALFNKFLFIPMHNAQNTSTFDIQAITGMDAKVIEQIPQGGFGKIQYNVSGSVVSSPAKTVDGGGISLHQTVEIMYVENHTAFVRGK
jgi:membrane protein implicated in regulation of membrane protease activity